MYVNVWNGSRLAIELYSWASRGSDTDRLGGAEAEHLDPELVARVEAV